MGVLQEKTAQEPGEAAKAAMEAGRLTDEQLAVIKAGLEWDDRCMGIYTMIEEAGKRGLGGLAGQLMKIESDFGWFQQLGYAAKGKQDVYGREVLRQLWQGELPAMWERLSELFAHLDHSEEAVTVRGWMLRQAADDLWINKLGLRAWEYICSFRDGKKTADSSD